MVDALQAAVRADELAARLADALGRAQDDAFGWLQAAQAQPPVPTPPPVVEVESPLDPSVPLVQERILKAGTRADAMLDDLRRFQTANPGRAIVVQWRVKE